jgi:hypothetical protein
MTFDPIVDARLRWEDVDATTKKADAVTLRVRGGAEIKHKASGLSVLVEGTGTVALDNDFNAFPFANAASNQYRTAYAVIPDGQNAAFNRVQIVSEQGVRPDHRSPADQSGRSAFHGSVAWRQNEQTFDAIRATINSARSRWTVPMPKANGPSLAMMPVCVTPMTASSCF